MTSHKALRIHASELLADALRKLDLAHQVLAKAKAIERRNREILMGGCGEAPSRERGVQGQTQDAALKASDA